MKIEMSFNNYEIIDKMIDESTLREFVVLLNVFFGAARNKFGDDNIKKELLKPNVHIIDFMKLKENK